MSAGVKALHMLRGDEHEIGRSQVWIWTQSHQFCKLFVCYRLVSIVLIGFESYWIYNHRFRFEIYSICTGVPVWMPQSLWVAHKKNTILHGFPCVAFPSCVVQKWLYSQTKLDIYQVHGGQGDNPQSEWPLYSQFWPMNDASSFFPVDLGLAFLAFFLFFFRISTHKRSFWGSNSNRLFSSTAPGGVPAKITPTRCSDFA